jgi:cyclic pyranopterin phosphate synthase
MCHPLAISKAEVRVEPADGGLAVTARVKTTGQTGVEMEALTAVSVACLTLYDMLKAADPAMTIGPVRLLEKHGGRHGSWRHPDLPDPLPASPEPGDG